MAKNNIWITKDNRKMRMCEMTDAHLINAINYFKKHKKSDDILYQLLIAEQLKRNKNNKVTDESVDNRFDILDL